MEKNSHPQLHSADGNVLAVGSYDTSGSTVDIVVMFSGPLMATAINTCAAL